MQLTAGNDARAHSRTKTAQVGTSLPCFSTRRQQPRSGSAFLHSGPLIALTEEVGGPSLLCWISGAGGGERFRASFETLNLMVGLKTGMSLGTEESSSLQSVTLS